MTIVLILTCDIADNESDKDGDTGTDHRVVHVRYGVHGFQEIPERENNVIFGGHIRTSSDFRRADAFLILT